MALENKKSLYDRNYRNIEGNTVGTNKPSDGQYFTNRGNEPSPFISKTGDQMVDLLQHNVLSSGDQGLTYKPSPKNPGEFADLNGGYPKTNPTLGQFGGPYRNTGPEKGYY